MTTDEHPYLCKFRIWPDHTLQWVEGNEAPFAHMSDDFVTIMAPTDVLAFDILHALESGGMRAEFEDRTYAYYLDRRSKGDFENHPERGDDTRESIFWKNPDGSYGVHAIQSAWQGFKWGRGLE